MNPTAIRFFPERGNKLSFLDRPITTMFGIIDRYVADQVHSGCFDLPYHHTERATLSLFAGALWRSHPDNLVLEEFGTEKTWESAGYRGRRDIWFSASGHNCFGEAKQEWANLSAGSTEIDSSLVTLEEETIAAIQALSTSSTSNRSEMGLGILFTTPYVLKSRIVKAASGLNRRHKELESRLATWYIEKKFHILWATYVRSELLEEAGCYEWYDGQLGSCPCLDTLICTPA